MRCSAMPIQPCGQSASLCTLCAGVLGSCLLSLARGSSSRLDAWVGRPGQQQQPGPAHAGAVTDSPGPSYTPASCPLRTADQGCRATCLGSFWSALRALKLRCKPIWFACAGEGVRQEMVLLHTVRGVQGASRVPLEPQPPPRNASASAGAGTIGNAHSRAAGSPAAQRVAADCCAEGDGQGRSAGAGASASSAGAAVEGTAASSAGTACAAGDAAASTSVRHALAPCSAEEARARATAPAAPAGAAPAPAAPAGTGGSWDSTEGWPAALFVGGTLSGEALL
jgi:hypothetical protein